VNVKHQAGGAGQIDLVDSTDFALDNVDKWLLLKRTGTLAEEILRSYGADRDARLRFFRTFANSVQTKTASFTVASADRGRFFLLDASSGAITVTLPTTEPAGFVVGFKRIDSSVFSVNLDAGTGKVINTAQQYWMSWSHESIWLVYDGSNWGILNDYRPGMLLQGKFTLTIPAAYINPRASQGCGPLATVETTTNKANYRYLPFDPSAAEFAQFEIGLPKMWDEGNVEARVLWSCPTASLPAGVVWEFGARARADNNAMDIAFGPTVLLADTASSADTLYWTAWSAALPVSGASEESGQLFQVSRKVADANDTLAVDARLHLVQIRINLDRENDG
jgi:hypothetical protein